MRAFDPEVKDAVWSGIEALIPVVNDPHPLGCHRPKVPDRVCFEGILIRLVTGCLWEDAERLMGGVVSDTTLRARRDEWEGRVVLHRDQLGRAGFGSSDQRLGPRRTRNGGPTTLGGRTSSPLRPHIYPSSTNGSFSTTATGSYDRWRLVARKVRAGASLTKSAGRES
jgi:transposase